MICPNCGKLLWLNDDNMAWCSDCDEHWDVDEIDLYDSIFGPDDDGPSDAFPIDDDE